MRRPFTVCEISNLNGNLIEIHLTYPEVSLRSAFFFCFFKPLYSLQSSVIVFVLAKNFFIQKVFMKGRDFDFFCVPYSSNC